MKRPQFILMTEKEPVVIQAVLFDKDGTLIDSLGPWSAVLRRLAEGLVESRISSAGSGHKPADTAHNRIMDSILASVGIQPEGINKDGLLACGTVQAIYSAIRHALETGFGQPENAESFTAEADKILKTLLPEGSPESAPLPGAEKTLRALYNLGIPTGLATSDSNSNTRADLKRHKWKKYFTQLFCGDTSAIPKPDPWVVYEFSRITGVAPEAVLFVGDTETDRRTAEASGAVYYQIDKSMETLCACIIRTS